MSVLILFVILVCMVHGEDNSARFIQNVHYEVEGIVQLKDLVNFVQPLLDQNSKFIHRSFDTAGGFDDKLSLDSFDTRRSDKPGNPENQDAQGASEQILQITQEIPVPYPVTIEKKVHYPVPIPVEQPVPIHVPQPYEVRIEKKVPVPVAIPVARPFPIHKTVPVPVEVPVENPVPYLVYKPVPFYIQRNVAQPIIKHVPLQVEVPVGVNKEVQVPFQVVKKVPLYIPKPVPYEIKIPIEKTYKVEIPVPYPVHIENQMASSKEVRITMMQLFNGAKYLFEKSVEHPVDMRGGRFRMSQQSG